MDIKLAKTNIRKQVGGSLLTAILSLGRAFAPTLDKTLGLPALVGLASEGAWARLHKTPVTVTGIRKCTRNLSELH